MYKKHFGLKELPFRNNLDFNFFYQKAARLEILNALIYVIKRGDAVIKVTGEVGSGKTTLLRLVSISVTDFAYLIYINTPNLTPRDLLYSIATELEIDVINPISKFELIQLIRDQLLKYYKEQKTVVILVDEAQSMSVDTLEELRLLTNLETDKDKLVQLVLFGQQELNVALDRQTLRQLKSRISYSIHIPQLTVNDVYDYLNHRMRVAEYKGLDFFSFKHAKRIHLLSNGLPRTINCIADQLLMATFGSGDSQLNSQHFKNLDTLQLYKVDNDYRQYFYGFIIVFLIFFAGVFFYYSQLNNSEEIKSEVGLVDNLTNLSDFKDFSFFHTNPVEMPEVKTFVVLNDNAESDKSISNEFPRDNLDNEEPLKQPHISNRVISKNPESLVVPVGEVTNLFKLHKKTEAWLNSLPDNGFVIQLSTSTPRDYLRLLQRYSSSGKVMNNMHFMLALNDSDSKLILKSFYLASSSYSTLSEEILLLPKIMQLNKPFIVNVSNLKASARQTTHKLEAMEVR